MYYLQSRYYDPAIGRFISADAYAMTYETPVGANMFAYCGNNPMMYTDNDGKVALPAIIVIGSSALFGGVVSAFFAAATGQNVVEAAVKGSVTGAVGATFGLFLQPVAAVTAAFCVSTFFDVAFQSVDQYTETGKVDLSKIDKGSALKTGIQTGLATALPAIGNAKNQIIDAVATSVFWNEVSSIIATFDVIINGMLDSFWGE